MKYLKRFDLMGPRFIAGYILTVILIAIVVGYLVDPVWGAIVTASASSIISCIGLANYWHDRQESLRPRVIFYPDRVGDDILFRLSNVGQRPAFNVLVALENPLKFQVGEKDWKRKKIADLREMVGFFRSPISILAPGQTITTINTMRTGNEFELEKTVINSFLLPENENNPGTIKYRDLEGKEYSDVTSLGFAALENLNLVTTVNITNPQREYTDDSD